MTLKARLIISLGLLTAVIIGLIAAGYMSMQVMRGNTDMLVNDHLKPISNLKVIADAYAVAIVDNVHKTRAGTVSWEESASVMDEATTLIDRLWTAEVARPKPAEDMTAQAPVEAAIIAAQGELEALTGILKAKNQEALVDFAENRLYPAIDPISAAISDEIVLLQDNAIDDLVEIGVFQDMILVIMVMAGIFAVAAIGYGGYVIVRSVADRLRRLQLATSRVASGRLEEEVPFTGRSDEIGLMAQATEIFRKNSLALRDLTAREAADLADRSERRRQMMAELREAFGSVVNAARAGQLHARVNVQFADAELNALAADVNQLLDTVESGVSATAEVLGALAQADLEPRVQGRFEGAFAKLRDDTNAVAEKMTEIVLDLRATSGSLRTATSELLAGANDLSERTTRQAATIEETSAAMEQLAATVTENAKSAYGASSLTRQATEEAEQTGATMSEAREAMARITAASRQIANIIGMIDDIAFQTNLLALNASVEAARAGDAGSGFAVVAQEVRRLAQSAAQSSSQVKALIESSGAEIRNGAELVNSAESGLASVLRTVREGAETMQRIASASQGQAAAIGEVTIAVRHLDEATQHNAALVEETNAAIEQTEAQAAALDGLISVFRVARQRSATSSSGSVESQRLVVSARR